MAQQSEDAPGHEADSDGGTQDVVGTDGTSFYLVAASPEGKAAPGAIHVITVEPAGACSKDGLFLKSS